MSENKHQLMLRDLRRIDVAVSGLCATISLGQGFEVTKKQADIITNYLNNAALKVYEQAQKEGMMWDAILLGALQFFNGVMTMAEKDLKTNMVRAEMPVDVKEVIH